MSIQDGPNYFEYQFPFSAPPRLLFDGVEVQPRPAKDPHITDTTFRDGQQARAPYTPEQVRSLFDYLHRLSGERGLVRQSEFFLYSESDRRALELCQERGYRFPEVTAWIRAQRGDFELVRRSGVNETGILTSSSDYHIFRKLRLTRHEALGRYLAVVDQALSAGITPRCHFEDVTRADLYGFVVPFAEALRMRAEEAGRRIKVRLCDTLGVATFHPGAAAPRSVQRIVAALRDDAGFAPEDLEWHGHNDLGMGLANAVTAWRYGVGAINGTLFGFGERTGNTPIEELIFEWMGLTGEQDVDTRAITDAAEYFERELGYSMPPMTPLVGRSSVLTGAGIHADGLLKDQEIYMPFDSGALLGRPPGVLITDKAGTAGVAFWLSQRRQREGLPAVPKDDPDVLSLHAWVQDQYREGRTTAVSDEEIETALRGLHAH